MADSIEESLRKIRKESKAAYDEALLVAKDLTDEQLEELIDTVEKDVLESNARLNALEDIAVERGIY